MLVQEVISLVKSRSADKTTRDAAFNYLKRMAKRSLDLPEAREGLFELAEILFHLQYIDECPENNFQAAEELYKQILSIGSESHHTIAAKRLAALKNHQSLFQELLLNDKEILAKPYNFLAALFKFAYAKRSLVNLEESSFEKQDTKLLDDFIQIILKESLLPIEETKKAFESFITYRLSLLKEQPLLAYHPLSALNLLCTGITLFLGKGDFNQLWMKDYPMQEDAYGNALIELKQGQFIPSEDTKSFIALAEFFDASFVRIKEGQTFIFKYIDSTGKEKLLSEVEKQFLIGLLPDARLFFEQAKNYSQENKETILGVLQQLREGLLRGDAGHSGSEMNAGVAANEAIVKFSEWFENLPSSIKNKLRALECHGLVLGDILDSLFKPLEAAKDQSTVYCIAGLGSRLDDIINRNEKVLREQSAQLYVIEQLKLSLTQQSQDIYVETLLRAISDNDTSLAALLLESYPELIKNKNALLLACRENKSDIVKLFLSHDPELIHRKKEEGRSLLWFAVKKDFFDLAKILIEAGVSVHPSHDKGSVLGLAAEKGHENLVTLLLDKGALCNNKASLQPLYSAASHGHINIVRILLQRGAEINKRSGRNNKTPIEAAASRGHFEIIRFLIENGSPLSRTAIKYSSSNRHKYIEIYLNCIWENWGNNNYKNNPYVLIRQVLLNYSQAFGNLVIARSMRFFKGQWGNHYGDIVAKLLFKPEYQTLDKNSLKAFLKELSKEVDAKKLTPLGELRAILTLVNELTKINFEKINEIPAPAGGMAPSPI